jgi:tRNA (cytosine38-C5)-methyltransferase
MVIRCAEFFSGIGGMHFGIQGISDKELQVIAAFDINQIANTVYAHNFGLKPITMNIEHLNVEYFEKLSADAWLLSPPCQPYTRGGNMKDDEDNRAAGLLHLINVLSEMKNPPRYLFLENVLNFEVSRSRNRLVDILLQKSYSIEEYLVSPLDLGIPNYRLRYYMIAQLAPFSQIKPLFTSLLGENSCQSIEPIEMFLRPPNEMKPFLVPEKYITDYKEYRHDVVHPLDTKCTTFTKAYGSNYIIGTGSFLQTTRLDLKEYPKDNPEILLTLGLRFFTPTEIALLHCFPLKEDHSHSFSQYKLEFPPSVSLMNQYRLLGNSMNVKVVNHLVTRLFRDKLI